MNKPPKRRLYELYWEQENSIENIARQYTTSTDTVRSWFDSYGIRRIPHTEQRAFAFRQLSKERLYEYHWRQDKCVAEIADEHNVGEPTVRAALNDSGVPRHWKDAAHHVFDRVRKRVLYRLYWGDKQTFEDIATRFAVSATYVQQRFADEGIPYSPSHNHDAWIFAMRDKTYYYELYWGQRMGYADIAAELDIGVGFVGRHIRGSAVPTRGGSPGEPDDIPPKFQWPDEKSVAPVTDDPKADLPDDPDGSKYLADETQVQYDKDRLYELYWGYGLAMTHLAERLNLSRASLRDRLEQYGIPVRKWHEHTTWEPHHGVPPKYQWPHDRNVDDEEPSVQNGIWRQPASGD